MQRDWNTIREILEKVENDTLVDFIKDLEKDRKFGKGDAAFESEVALHVQLLREGGYIVGITVNRWSQGSVDYSISEPRMTMQGYDLLEVLRTKGVMERIREKCKQLGVPLTAAAIQAVLSSLIS